MVAELGAAGGEGLAELLEWSPYPGGRDHHVQEGEAHRL